MNPNSEQAGMIARFRGDLNKLIADRIDGEASDETQRQRRRLDKVDNYYRGNQYLAEEYNAAGSTWSPVTSGSGAAEDLGVLDYVVDVVRSYGRKYYSVLGTRPFHNAKAVADDPKNEADRAAARQYDLASIFLKTKWNARVMNIMVFYHQYKSGNVYAFVDHVADKELFGETVEPVFTETEVEIEPAGYRCTSCRVKSPEPLVLPIQDQVTGNSIDVSTCPNCGAELPEFVFEEAQTAMIPEQTGEKRYPNAGPRLKLCTGFQVTLPHDTADLPSAPWLLYEYEEHPGALLQLYRDQLQPFLTEKGDLEPAPGGDENDNGMHEQGKRSRQMAASIGGHQYSSEKCKRWRYSRYWLAAFMYEYLPDEAKRKELYANFPDGLKVTRVQNHVVKLENEAITESWSVFEPEPGDYLYKDPLCWGILGHQDITNDMANLMVQILERVMPAMAFDPDVIDGDSISGGSGRPNEMIPAKPGTSGRLEGSIAKIPTSAFPDHAPQLIGMMETNLQSHLGLQPSVYGGGEKTDTAEQARIQLNQALMQLAVPGEFAGIGWKNTLENAIKKIKKHGLKAGAIPTSKSDSELFDIDALRNGNAHFESEFGVPMSWGERRDQLNHIIGQNPQLAHALGIDAPTNIPVVRDFLLPGMDELMVPGEERREKIHEVIRDILKGPGAISDQPTILPEPFVDDPMDAVLVLDWLRSDAGRKIKRENPLVYQDVVNYGLAMGQLPPPMGTPPMLPPPEDGAPAPAGKPPKESQSPMNSASGSAMPPAQIV